MKLAFQRPRLRTAFFLKVSASARLCPRMSSVCQFGSAARPFSESAPIFTSMVRRSTTLVCVLASFTQFLMDLNCFGEDDLVPL